MKDYTKKAPILVEWEDTTSPPLGWEIVEEMTVAPNLCHSIGWIVQRSKGCVIIVPHLTPPLRDGQAGTGRITIPQLERLERSFQENTN